MAFDKRGIPTNIIGLADIKDVGRTQRVGAGVIYVSDCSVFDILWTAHSHCSQIHYTMEYRHWRGVSNSGDKYV